MMSIHKVVDLWLKKVSMLFITWFFTDKYFVKMFWKLIMIITIIHKQS